MALETIFNNLDLKGTFQGDVSATGFYYDANGLVTGGGGGIGVDTGVRSLTSTWQDTSTTVQGNSAQWASNIDLGVRSLTGDFFTNDGGNIYGNVLVFGTLSATQGITNVSTAITSTSTLSVLNTDPTSPGPALVVEQAGPFDIAVFRDSEGGDIVHINNITPLDGAPGAVGIRTSHPNETLTVRGTLSASGLIYSQGNNSNQWGNTTTTVQSNSAQWASNVDTGVRALSGNWQSTYTTVQNNSATNWDNTNLQNQINTIISQIDLDNGIFSSFWR